MMTERPHRKLVLWQKAMDFVADVYRLCQGFPASERFGITSQIQRAAVSVPSNIAEGAARRTRRLNAIPPLGSLTSRLTTRR
jgi:hypothetical protein